MSPLQLGRRQLLATSTGTVAACALCACGGSQTDATTPTAPPGGGQQLISLSDLPVGDAKSVTADGSKLIVVRTAEDSAVAFSAICTHQGCTVAPAGNELRCPCHGSTYDTRTGMVTGGPAPKPLKEIPVRVDSGNVVTA